MGANLLRLMAIDYGEKRIGLASTDESGRFSLPRVVLPNDETFLDNLLHFQKEHKIDQIIIGESKDFEGLPNPIQNKIETLKSELEKRGLIVVLHPEVFTTMEAERIQGRNKETDASAAALILKSYLDSMYNK